MAENFGKSLTLCWHCRRAFLGSCPWSENLEPVPGWVADVCKLGGIGTSYNVKSCPMFRCDTRMQEKERVYHAKPIADNDGVVSLAAQIVKQACVDYVKAYKALQDPKRNEKIKKEWIRYALKKKEKGMNPRDILTLKEYANRKIGNWKKTIIDCQTFFMSHYFGLISNMDGRRLMQQLKQAVMQRVELPDD